VWGFFIHTAHTQRAQGKHKEALHSSCHKQDDTKEKIMKFISAKNVGLLVAAGLIASTGTSIAAETTAPTAPTTKTHTPSPEIAAFKSAIATYKANHEATVNAFKSAIAAAKTAKEAAIKAATTPEAKAAAKTAFQSAVTSAKATRDAAIAALGTKPVRPAQSAK
jgi:hypothetical protein